MKFVQKTIIKLKYLMEIVLMKMGHLRDIFAHSNQIEINLLYIFYLIYKKYFIQNSFLNKNQNKNKNILNYLFDLKIIQNIFNI